MFGMSDLILRDFVCRNSSVNLWNWMSHVLQTTPLSTDVWWSRTSKTPLLLLSVQILYRALILSFPRSCLIVSYRSIVNEAAAASPKQPIVNMGQGFFGYNPPEFIINAAKAALDKVDCNQYSPTKGRPRLKKAIADSYSPLWGRKLDPETEVTITTGANEGWVQHSI